MQVLNETEAKQQFSQILETGKPVMINHPKKVMVMISKDYLDLIEMELMGYEMDRIIKNGQKKYSGKEVEAMLAEVLKDA